MKQNHHTHQKQSVMNVKMKIVKIKDVMLQLTVKNVRININNMNYHFDGARNLLLEHFRTEKVISRRKVHQLALDNMYEPASYEREIRNMVHEVGLIPLNWKGKPANTEEKEKIVAWRYAPHRKMNSVIKKAIWKKRKLIAMSSR